MYYYLFKLIDLIAFILPAIPSDLNTRLTILFIYFVMHAMQLQRTYANFKNKLITEK